MRNKQIETTIRGISYLLRYYIWVKPKRLLLFMSSLI